MNEKAQEAPPDLTNVQANILHGSALWDRAAYLFYRIDSVQGTREFIAALVESGHVHTANKWEGVAPRDSNINIAFTNRGLEVMRLGISDSDRFLRNHVMRSSRISKFLNDGDLGSSDYDTLGEQPLPAPDGQEESPPDQDDADGPVTAFEGGMRVAKIGDVWPEVVDGEFKWSDETRATAWWSDESDPQQWEDDVTLWPHLLVWISEHDDDEHGNDVPTDLVRLVRELAARKRGPTEMGIQTAKSLNNNEEHFGFVDGISQPAVEGIRPGRPGDGKLGARGWEGLKVGEFILGYTDEGYNPPSLMAEDDPMRDGTFLVYRKIAQDVDAFDTAAATMADRSGLPKADVAARLMGRKQNGDPLVAPQGSPDQLAENLRNDFTYAGDQEGLRCPFGSHVRRSNPRDDLHFEGRRVNRHRIIRRGMPYGPPFVDDPDAARGLIFIAFNSRIEDQFEFIQKEWLNTGRTFRTGDDAEPVAGLGEKIRIVINGDRLALHQQPRPFTEFRGGDYFFVPSMSTLDSIASGSFTTKEQARLEQDGSEPKGRNGVLRPRVG